MAVSMASTKYPFTRRETIATADNLLEVTMPDNIRHWLFTVQPITNAGKLTHTGTDGGAIGSDYVTLNADVPSEVVVSGGSVFVTGDTNGTVLELVVEAPAP